MFESIEALVREGRWSDALLEAEALVSAHPENSKAHAYVGLCAESLGDFQKAASQLQKAFALDPHFWQAGKQLILCLDKIGRHDDALAVAREVQRLRPSDSHIESEILRLEALAKSYRQPSKPMTWGV